MSAKELKTPQNFMVKKYWTLKKKTGKAIYFTLKIKFNMNILHYKRWNTAIATSMKFAAQAKRGLQSHSLNPLCFVSSNAYYFSKQLFWEFYLV